MTLLIYWFREEKHIFFVYLQVVIGTGCFTFAVFTLDYGGPFDCTPVQYMTGGIIGGALLIGVVVAACYRGRRRVHKVLHRTKYLKFWVCFWFSISFLEILSYSCIPTEVSGLNDPHLQVVHFENS